MAFINRNLRHSTDSMIRARNYMAILSWIIMFAMFVIASIARPRYDTLFNRVFNSPGVTGPWEKDILVYAFYLAPFLALVSIIGLVINSSRHKRKYDTYSKSLVAALVVAVISGIIYFMFLI